MPVLQIRHQPRSHVFARTVTLPLTKLIREVEVAAEKHKAQQMGACVIFLSDRINLADKLRQLAKKENLQHVILAIDNSVGPERYNVVAEADVTMILYENHTVRANHAFRKGRLDAAAIQRILADVPKIIASK